MGTSDADLRRTGRGIRYLNGADFGKSWQRGYDVAIGSASASYRQPSLTIDINGGIDFGGHAVGSRGHGLTWTGGTIRISISATPSLAHYVPD